MKLKKQNEELPENVILAQYAIAWCLKHEAVSSVMPGGKNVEQVSMNLEAAELDLRKAN